jgi:hypothetical protein
VKFTSSAIAWVFAICCGVQTCFIEGARAQNVCRVEQRSGAGIQAAIDACYAKGGGVALVPAGLLVSGPIWLKDNVELRLEPGALIQMSRKTEDWPKGVQALVNARDVKHIAVTGQGTFDGNATWTYEDIKRPDVDIADEQANAARAGVEMKRYYRSGEVQKYLFVLHGSQDIRLEGITIKNAPLWNVKLRDCDRVWIRGVYVFSDLEKGVNSDGIDIVSSSNVTISDSTIVTGDDAICLKTGDMREVGVVRPTENVLVTNCILSSSSTPMMIGTETHADIRHVLFSNIVVRDSNKVLGINVQDGAVVSDVRFSNVTFETNRRHWNWWGNAEVMKIVLRKRTPESRLGKIEHIVVDGLQGTARGTSVIAGHVERPLNDIKVSNLRVRMLAENKPDKRATHGFVFQDVKDLTLQDVQLEWDTELPEPMWQSSLMLKNIDGLDLRGWKGKAAKKGVPAIVKKNVR